MKKGDLAAMSAYGVVTGPQTVRLERELPGPIERVWAYLTEPEKRAKWLAGGAMELRVGGAVSLQFHHASLTPYNETPPDKYKAMECGHSLAGTVTACEPPRLLAYTWGEGGDDPSEVTFELTAKSERVLLVVTHRRLCERKIMVSVAAGWHIHVDILEAALLGAAPPRFWDGHGALEQEYDKRLPAE